MPDNTAKIAEVRAKLQAGATSVATDGTQVSYDLDALRAELRRLELEDTATQTRRPAVGSISLGNF